MTMTIVRAAGVAAFVLAATPAMATDLMGDGGAAGHDWSGLYVGGTVGVVTTEVDTSNVLFEGSDAGLGTISYSASGWLAGVTLGANMQMDGGLVAGIEGDYSLASADASFTNTDYGFTATARLQSLGTLRGRLGFSAGNVLIYGTGGLAMGQLEGQIDDTYGSDVVTTTDTASYFGWTAGAGAEVAVSDTMSLKGEALYYDLGSQGMTFNEGSGGWNPITNDSALTGWVGRVGINFKMQ